VRHDGGRSMTAGCARSICRTPPPAMLGSYRAAAVAGIQSWRGR
jgi:hypothetical protein